MVPDRSANLTFSAALASQGRVQKAVPQRLPIRYLRWRRGHLQNL